MEFFKTNSRGIALCLAIAVPAWILGTFFPIVGGPVIAILLGMLIAIPLKNQGRMAPGIKFTSKKVLQWAVVLLGFGLDLTVVLKTGKQSLPIIVCTIAVSLLIAFVLHKALRIPSKISTLVGVGSSICGGSAIAATAPVIDADDEEVAQSISVIFFFNVLAAILFPILGNLIGFSTTSGEAFGSQRHLLCHRSCGPLGQHVGIGNRHPGQSGHCEAHPHPGHHPHHLGAGLSLYPEGAEKPGERGQSQVHLPLFHSLFYRGQPSDHRRGPLWGGCQRLFPH